MKIQWLCIQCNALFLTEAYMMEPDVKCCEHQDAKYVQHIEGEIECYSHQSQV